MAEAMRGAPRDNPEVLHETSDVSVNGILGFAGALAVLALVIHIALYGLLAFYGQRDASRAAPPSGPRQDQAAPEPRLQVAPRADLLEMRKAEEKLLGSYGWVDREKNLARIPIEQGMEAALKRGLPVRTQTPSPPAGAQKNPTGEKAR